MGALVAAKAWGVTADEADRRQQRQVAGVASWKSSCIAYGTDGTEFVVDEEACNGLDRCPPRSSARAEMQS